MLAVSGSTGFTFDKIYDKMTYMRKSLMAKIVSVYLRCTFRRRDNVSKEVAFTQFSSELDAGEKEYKPSKIMGCTVSKLNFDGMDTYVLNGGSKINKTVIYFHGGGYVHQPVYYHWRFVKKLIKKTGVKVIFPIYPLAPFYTYKDMYAKTLKMYEEISATDGEIIFMGDSAGAGFILAFYEYLISNNLRLPDKVISLSPWLDLASDNPQIDELAPIDPMVVPSTAEVWAELWAGNDKANYMVSPINFDKLDLLKNVSIFIGTDEILYPDALKFFEKIKNNSGCRLYVGERMNHVYPLYPIPEARLALKQIVDIIMN